MRFYYENHMGDSGHFSEKDLVKAIYTAWNIEADLHLVIETDNSTYQELRQMIFVPFESADFNSDLLKEFGYYVTDDWEIKRISDDMEEKYDWSEVKQLV